MDEHTGAYSMSAEDTDPARLSEQNVQVTQADHLSFRAWLSFCIEQARYNRDSSDPRAAEIMTTILEQYDARHRTRAEPELVEIVSKVCRDYANKAKQRGWITSPESAAMAAKHIEQNVRAALTRADV